MKVSVEFSRNPNFSPGAKTVYLALKSYYPNVWPGVEVLSKNTAMSKRTIISKIKELEHHGLIFVERKRGTGNVYRMSDPKINREQIEQKVVQKKAPVEEDSSAITAPEVVQKLILEVVQKLHSI